MAVVSTKGLKIWIALIDAVPITLVPTAITDAAQPVVTVASTAGVAVGDLVNFSGTGFVELDGKSGVVAALTGTSLTIAGLSTVGSAGVLGPSPVAEVFAPSDMCELCLAGIDFGDSAPSPISVATFCNPIASVPGNPQPATITLTGYVDVADPCYPEMLAAVEDGLPRQIKVDLPGGNGYLITTMIFGSVGYALPLEGATGFTFTGTQTTALRHVF